jgi:adenylate cyclase
MAQLSHGQRPWGYATDPQFERNEAVRLSRLALSLDDGDQKHWHGLPRVC